MKRDTELFEIFYFLRRSDTAMDIELDFHVFGIPEELKNLKWCLWKWQWNEDKQKWTKPPYSLTGQLLSTNDPGEWCSYPDVEAYEHKGFLLSKEYVLCVVDLDKCRDPKTGVIAEWAWKIINALNSYTEVSPSGEGVHIIVYGTKPRGARSRFHLEGHEIEVYDSNRYITFTAQVVDSYYFVRNGEDWIDENVPADTPASDDAPSASDDTSATENLFEGLEATDEELITMLSHAKHGDTVKKLFFDGDWSDFESHSEADLRLCSILSFATAANEERIDRLFRSSALYRDKWERVDYRNWTINRAIDSTENFYVQPTRYKVVGNAEKLSRPTF